MGDIGIRQRLVEQITILDTDSQVRIGLRFGGSSVPLSRAVDSLLERGVNRILLNLKGAGSINASGIGEIVAAYVAVKKTGGQFKLVNLTPIVRELMMTTKLLTIFDVYDNEAQAIESFLRSVPSESGKELAVVHAGP
jgi:anti-sigma B factor antagonist